VIYLDTSVALAQILAEDRHPPDEFWRQMLVSSRLLEYELWTRIHALRLVRTHAPAVHALLGRVAILELIPEILGRARDPYPVSVRTLDALHLAAAHFLLEQGQPVTIASYDQRLLAGARALHLEVHELP
jgi:predicted nucleic acid-binding protein